MEEFYQYGGIEPNYECDKSVNVTDSTIQFCIKQMTKVHVPDIIKKFINSQGCKFFFTENNAIRKSEAWYSHPKMVIRLDKKSSLAHKAGIAMHEYCHCYDHIIGKEVFGKPISSTDEGKFLYDRNMGENIEQMYKKNIKEFIAYSIQRYYCDSKKFYEQFPDIFEFIKHIEKMFIIYKHKL